MHHSRLSTPLIDTPDELAEAGTAFWSAALGVPTSSPPGGAVAFRQAPAETVMAVTRAGFGIQHLEEHSDPFWRPGGVEAASRNGQVPNTVSLLAWLGA